MNPKWYPRDDCKKCGGAGWLWAYELDSYHGDNPCYDDTRYSCDDPLHLSYDVASERTSRAKRLAQLKTLKYNTLAEIRQRQSALEIIDAEIAHYERDDIQDSGDDSPGRVDCCAGSVTT